MEANKISRRDLQAREHKLIKRCVFAGYTDEQIGDLFGRTTRGVRGIREYYGWTFPERYKTAGSHFSPETNKEINQLIVLWVGQGLSPAEMSEKLAVRYPPGLHRATITKRIKMIGPATEKKHRKNMLERKSEEMVKRQKEGKGVCRTRNPKTGAFETSLGADNRSMTYPSKD